MRRMGKHAFDSAGRMYNQNGKLEVWWTNETSEAFDEKQQCLSKQYSCECFKLFDWATG